MTVSGKTDTIKKLVKMKDDYAVQITMSNLRWEQKQVMADVLEVQIVEIEKVLKLIFPSLSEEDLLPLENVRDMRLRIRKQERSR